MEQPKLGHRQADLLARLGHRMCPEIQLDRADFESRFGGALYRPLPPAAAQLRPNARDQLAMAERLGQVVVGAGLESAHLVLFRIQRRKHDDG